MEEKEYTISIGSSRLAKTWKNTAITLDDFIERLRLPVVTPESMADYAAMSHALKSEKKDVGGYVAGSLKDGKRKADAVSWRSMVTLDLDNVDVSTTKALDILHQRCQYLWICHPSHSHRDNAPRLRLIVPLETPVTAEQYEPIARRIAADIDVDWFDITTYQPSRLMYWPSVPSDLDYDAVFTVHDGPLCAGNEVLDRYTDWRNVAEWPRSGREAEHVKRLAKRQSNPLEKDNIVGAFCRTYTMDETLGKFLADEYEPTDKPGRYTYTGGSTVGGLVLYDDVFAYDNHATSPSSGQLCNAFDLVRVHKFGEMDSGVKLEADPTKRPSYVAMIDFASKDKSVRALMAAEREEQIENDFIFEESPDFQRVNENKPQIDAENEAEDPKNDNWQDHLALDKNGLVAKTIENVRTILLHDKRFRGKLYTDTFAGRNIVNGKLPWDDSTEPRDWSDRDAANLRLYLEKYYKISGKDKINDGIESAFSARKRHPIREYLKGLPEWDGVERVESLLADYLGAHDTPYIRAVTKTHLVAAVARVLRPGVKYDTMITLSGKQGLGKSTLIRVLCGDQWFNDSLRDFKGKEPFELIQGSWMIEIGELSAYKKADKEEFKAFLSKTSDTYRPAYGRNTVRQPRQCVFWGTTNDTQFLRDDTGERRTWPVSCGDEPAIKDVFYDLAEERDQIWAEALKAYKDGWPLKLSVDMERAANEARTGFKEEDPRRDQIEEFLDRELPESWAKMDLMERRDYLDGVADHAEEPKEKRQRVTALEVWVECFRGNVKDFYKKDAAEINLILSNLAGWEKDNKQIRLDNIVYNGARKKLSYVRKKIKN